MSGPTSSPDWDRSGSSTYGTINHRSRLSSYQNGSSSVDSEAAQSNGGEVSPKRRPSPSRKPSGHIEFRKYLKRPHLSESQRTLSDALRAAKSRVEQETLLPDDDPAGSDGCFTGTNHLVGPRDVSTLHPHGSLKVYYNIHRYGDSLLAILRSLARIL